VARLAVTMNEMLDRLEDASRKQRRFVSDASHELRSPVASIRTQLEVALRRPDRSDWDVIAQRVLAEDERLESAGAEPDEPARHDEADRVNAPVEADLAGVVLEECSRGRRARVATSRGWGGRVPGRRGGLARVVRNLADTPPRHAASAVSISVTT